MNITNRQLHFFIFIFTVPFVISFLPQIMSASFGTGAWIYILTASLVYSVFAALIAYLGYSNQDKTLFEYAQPLVGKFLTYCFMTLYFVEFFLYTSFLTRSTTEIIHAEIMVDTPRWFLLIVIIIASGYVVSKGMTNLGRMVEFIGITSLIIAVILHTIMASQGNILNTKPFLYFSDPQKYISMSPTSLYLFSGFEFMTIIPFTKRNGFKSIGIAALSILSIGVFYIIVVESCYIILGVEDTANYMYPLIAAMRRIDINLLQFLKRIDIVFIFVWLTAGFFSISIALLTTIEYARKIINKPNNNLVLIVICISVFILGLIPKSDIKVSEYAVNVSTFISGITIFVIPVTLLIISKVKKHEKNMPDKP